jgi:hypothetical protein
MREGDTVRCLFYEPREWKDLHCGSKSSKRLQGYTNAIQNPKYHLLEETDPKVSPSRSDQ